MIRSVKEADFPSLAQAPFRIDPLKFKDIPIMAIVFDGK